MTDKLKVRDTEIIATDVELRDTNGFNYVVDIAVNVKNGQLILLGLPDSIVSVDKDEIYVTLLCAEPEQPLYSTKQKPKSCPHGLAGNACRQCGNCGKYNG